MNDDQLKKLWQQQPLREPDISATQAGQVGRQLLQPFALDRQGIGHDGILRCLQSSSLGIVLPAEVVAGEVVAGAPWERPTSFLALSAEADLAAFRLGRRRHELADRVADDFELGVVSLLQRFELAGEVGVRGEEPAQADEGAHDLDVDTNGARTPQDAGEHGDALLGEGVGRLAATTPT